MAQSQAGQTRKDPPSGQLPGEGFFLWICGLYALFEMRRNFGGDIDRGLSCQYCLFVARWISSQEEAAHKMPQKERQMREEYDFSHGIKNPYLGQQKTSVTITVDRETMDYFRRLSAETGISCRTLMGSYLADCAARRRPVPSCTANADSL